MKLRWLGESQKVEQPKEKGLLELRLPSFARVLPADEPNQVLHSGAGHGHHSHWQQSVLARVQGEVDVDLLGGCSTDMTLWTEHNESEAQSHHRADATLGPQPTCGTGFSHPFQHAPAPGMVPRTKMVKFQSFSFNGLLHAALPADTGQ